MNPRIGLLTPVKIALGNWLGAFKTDFQPDTAAAAEWAQREQRLAMAMVPGRMVDQVEEMLSSWRTNNNSGNPSTSAYIPVLLAALAPDYTESPAEHGRPLTDKLPFSFPGDTGHRAFKARVLHLDIRAQVVVVASEPATATSIVAQLSMWSVHVPTFHADFTFAGQTTQWPVKVLSADRIGIPTPVGEQLCILAVDYTLRASTPLFYGAGTAVDNEVPFPVAETIETRHNPAVERPEGVSAEEWQAFQVLIGAGRNPATDDSDAPGIVLCNIDDRRQV